MMSSEISEIMDNSKHVPAHVSSETETDFNAASENMNAGKSVLVKTDNEDGAEGGAVEESNGDSLKVADLEVSENKSHLEEPMSKLLLTADTTDSKAAEVVKVH